MLPSLSSTFVNMNATIAMYCILSIQASRKDTLSRHSRLATRICRGQGVALLNVDNFNFCHESEDMIPKNFEN